MVLDVHSSRTDLLELGSVANDIFGKIQDVYVFLEDFLCSVSVVQHFRLS